MDPHGGSLLVNTLECSASRCGGTYAYQCELPQVALCLQVWILDVPYAYDCGLQRYLMPISADFSCALCLQVRTAKVYCTMQYQCGLQLFIMCADCEGTSLCLLECGLWRYLMPTSSNSRDTLHAYKCGQGTSLMPTSLDSGVTTSAWAI